MSCGPRRPFRDCAPRTLVALSYRGPWSCSLLSPPRDGEVCNQMLGSSLGKQGSLSRELSNSLPPQENLPSPRGTRSYLGI